jgi:glyoxylase-like metal-dependent hydrolase (beta-lactamase superfamily II)
MIRFVFALVLTASATAQTVGEPLPAWTKDGMDIHFINTGRGDAALLVLPDGTSLQIDAGDGGWGAPPRGVVRKPNDYRSAGERLGRYARQVMPPNDDLKIDYVLLTHSHDDHMSGFRDLWSSIDLGVILDRGYPEYDYPGP